jgi:hypothetical protein
MLLLLKMVQWYYSAAASDGAVLLLLLQLHMAPLVWQLVVMLLLLCGWSSRCKWLISSS